MIELTNYKDSNGTDIKVGDILVFQYNNQNIEATIKKNVDMYIVETPNNLPFSCSLAGLNQFVTTYTVKVV